jgi:hypothetical protein
VDRKVSSSDPIDRTWSRSSTSPVVVERSGETVGLDTSASEFVGAFWGQNHVIHRVRETSELRSLRPLVPSRGPYGRSSFHGKDGVASSSPALGYRLRVSAS